MKYKAPICHEGWTVHTVRLSAGDTLQIEAQRPFVINAVTSMSFTVSVGPGTVPVEYQAKRSGALAP